MKTYSKVSESNINKSSSQNSAIPFFLPQRKASNFFGESENKEQNYFFNETQIIQRKSIEPQPIDDDKEELKEVLSTLVSLLNLEETIVLIVEKPNVQNYTQRLERFFESTKKAKSKELASIFQGEYEKIPTIFGSDYFMYKEDVEKIYKKINEEKWNIETTIKDAEDIFELRKLIEWHNNYSSHCFEDNPLTFSISKEEIDEIVRTWQNINSAFIGKYEGSNERVKDIFKIKYNNFKQEDINLISQKLKSNRLKKDSKDKFDESQSKMSADDQIKADPPLDVNIKDTKLKYTNKNYDLFNQGKKDSHEIDSNDIIQSQILGDCYYLATIASIAKVNPNYFKGVIEATPEKENYFKIVFYIQEANKKNYKKHEIFVDNDIPTIDPVQSTANPLPKFTGYGGEQELWVILLEKGLAKLFGSYKSIESGSPEFAFGLLTGKSVERINLHDVKDEALTAKLEENKNLKPIIFASKANATKPVNSNHAYYFESISNGLLNLRNPHGKDHLTNLSLNLVRTNFETIFIGETLK